MRQGDVIDGAVAGLHLSRWIALRCAISISPDECIEAQQMVHEGVGRCYVSVTRTSRTVQPKPNSNKKSRQMARQQSNGGKIEFGKPPLRL